MTEVVQPRTEPPFSYDQMKAWYDTLCVRQLEPALATVLRYLDEMLENNLPDFDRRRIILHRPGRIKSPARLWEKINRKYLEEISRLNDIPEVVDDLVGVRIICNNATDIGVVQTMLANLSPIDEANVTTMAFVDDEIYHEKPKPSGYRAYHVNLSVSVGSVVDAGWKRVNVELQVRTLLQDAWGELTHEDTYKPGTELPPLIKTLALRMANLLSCVEELAQDLRDELDRLGGVAVAKSPTLALALTDDAVPETETDSSVDDAILLEQTPAEDTDSSFPELAVLEETRAIVRGLDRPETLVNVAFRLQTLFGNQISREHWGRFGTFKKLLLHAAPNVQVENIGPGYIMPPGFTRDDIPGGLTELELQFADSDVPDAIRKLRQFETNLPALPGIELTRYISAAAAALDGDLWERLELSKNSMGIQEVNTLSKEIRDQVQKSGNELIRAKLGYILLALLNSGNLRPGVQVDEIRAIFASFLASRIGHHGMNLTHNDRMAIDEWLAR